MRALNRVFSRANGGFSLLFLGSLLSGCGPNFDPPSEMSTLRVLGVQKDKPYAQPGEAVNLKMLWEDASPKADEGGTPRAITRIWSPPCFDPPGDLYYSCFTDPSLFDPAGLTIGDETSFTMKPDVITPRPPPNAPYGIAYVFFAACAGTLQAVQGSSTADYGETGAIPVACLDPNTNQPLGSDDFVAGYVAVYSFRGFSNKNPVISGFEFNGQQIAADQVCISANGASEPPTDDNCIPLAGSATPADIDCTDPNETRCIPTCADDGNSSCHGYPLKPTMAQADNQEPDSVSAALLGRDVTEQMWIDYYTDGGGFKSPVRLLNDATSGWNDNYGTDFYAPKAAKVSRIWALAHDNRGGVAWAGISVKTQVSE